MKPQNIPSLQDFCISKESVIKNYLLKNKKKKKIMGLAVNQFNLQFTERIGTRNKPTSQ